MPLGLKNKTVILHATTTTKVRIDHTKRALLTHTPPPQVPVKDAEFLGDREGVVTLPLPRGKPKQVMVEEQLLFGHRKMNECTEKRNKQI